MCSSWRNTLAQSVKMIDPKQWDLQFTSHFPGISNRILCTYDFAFFATCAQLGAWAGQVLPTHYMGFKGIL
jgi:hypothetical protein